MGVIVLKLDESSWDNQELEAIYECLNNDQTTMSKMVAKFEDNFAHFVGARFAIMVNSGSSANLIAASSIQLKYPIEKIRNVVIVPALSWSTTYFPWIQLGYKLKFVDINLSDWNINTNIIEKEVTPDVAGICVPHILGAGANLTKLLDICKKNKIWMVEDACESLGNKPNPNSEKMLGAFADIGTYSFFRSHHISTMEGGMVVTDDEQLAIYSKSLRAHGWGRNIIPNKYLEAGEVDPWKSKFQFYLPGYNLRPLEISGAIGVEQLKKLPKLLEMRRKNASFLNDLLEDSNGFHVQNQGKTGSWMAFGIICENGNLFRNKIVQYLEKYGVETRPIVTGNFVNQPVMKILAEKFSIAGKLDNAQFVEDCGFMFANHGRNLEKEILEIVDLLKKF
jgi:CDP-6-deoxy-D-xylo-4-hexulose-3-dehydrase